MDQILYLLPEGNLLYWADGSHFRHAAQNPWRRTDLQLLLVGAEDFWTFGICSWGILVISYAGNVT
jgi:hypothetical protein